MREALDDVNLSLALHPKWCKALYRRAMLLLECGRYAEALTEFKAAQPLLEDSFVFGPRCWAFGSGRPEVVLQQGRHRSRRCRRFAIPWAHEAVGGVVFVYAPRRQRSARASAR